jgi:molybdopterin-synthase adenylyltransferase
MSGPTSGPIDLTSPARYARQVLVNQIGPEGQARLARSRAVVAGCGAFGCAAATLLARAGVGHLTLVDFDTVDISNLPRQTLYTEEDLSSGRPKSEIAAERLREANSTITIDARVAKIAAENAEELFVGADVIVDAVDNFDARFVVNDVAVKHGIPWVYGGVLGTYGLTMDILPGEGPCLRCLLGERPAPGTIDTTATEGVFAPIVFAIVALQIAEAVKILIGARDELRRELLQLDVWEGETTLTEVPREPDCVACGQRRFEYLEG